MKELITNKIISLGENLSDELKNKDITDYKLIINVKKDFFKKLDEDIFYRFKLDDNNNEFVPSENEIILSFGNNNSIVIQKEKSVDL